MPVKMWEVGGLGEVVARGQGVVGAVVEVAFSRDLKAATVTDKFQIITVVKK